MSRSERVIACAACYGAGITARGELCGCGAISKSFYSSALAQDQQMREASKVEEMASANKQANEQPIKKRAPDFLTAALGHMQDRAATYDKPEGERSMGATVVAFNAATGHALTETQGWIFMVFLKAIRTQQGAFRADNFEDMAAYAGLAGESAIRAQELEQ